MIKFEQILSSELLDDITSKIAEALPSELKPNIKGVQQDIEKNIRVILQASFAKLDLVSREEFDIQARVLERSREKLRLLEQRLDQLDIQSQ
ncbi:MAG: accessory factor UbiK family protein [Thiohalomonadales bacterium]